MENLDTEGRILLRAKQIYRVVSDKIAFLICPENPTFHVQDINIQYTKVFNTVKNNIKNLDLFGIRDALVTSAIIIAT